MKRGFYCSSHNCNTWVDWKLFLCFTTNIRRECIGPFCFRQSEEEEQDHTLRRTVQYNTVQYSTVQYRRLTTVQMPSLATGLVALVMLATGPHLATQKSTTSR